MKTPVSRAPGPVWIQPLLRSLDDDAAFLLRHRWAVYYAVLLAYGLILAVSLGDAGFRMRLNDLLTPSASFFDETTPPPADLAEADAIASAAQAWATGVR